MLSLSLMCPIKIFFILLMLLSSYKANLILLMSKDKQHENIFYILNHILVCYANGNNSFIVSQIFS